MVETDPDVLDKVLCYVYKRDYQVDAKSAVTIHPEVYALADYLGMQPLKQLVRKKFSEALKENWEVVSFTKALRTIYTTTPASDRGLRDAAKGHLSAHKKSLRNHKYVFSQPQYVSTAQRLPESGVETLTFEIDNRGFTDLVEKNFADGRFLMDVLDAFADFSTPASSPPATAAVAKKPRGKKTKAQS